MTGADAAPAGGPAQVGFEPSLVRRAPRTTAVGRNTSTVADLRRQVDGHLHAGFPHRIWVTGRVGRTGEDAEGGLPFRLHSSTEDEPFWLPCDVAPEAVVSVRELCARVHDADLEDVVAEGRLARVGGLLRYDFAANRLLLHVSELDPTPTALGLAEEREVAREQARAAGLGTRQRSRPLRSAPLRLAVVAPPDDPAAARVRSLLTSSGYAVDVRECPVSVHGVQAPALVAAAVREAAVRAELVLLLREEGRPLGLGVFDADPVVRAVGDAPVPVVTGLGGRGEPTASDDVAFLALSTADEVGDWVLTRLQDAEAALHTLAGEVRVAADQAADRARSALERERAAVEEAARAAQERAQARQHRRAQVVGALAVLLALAVVAAAVVTRRPLVLLGLLAGGAALLAAQQWSTWARGRPAPARRGSGMTAEDEFDSVLEHLREVREQLSGTSSPEKVARLRSTATELLDRGQQILGRSVGSGAPPRELAGHAPVPPLDPYPTSELGGAPGSASGAGAPAAPALAEAETQALPQAGSGSVRVLRAGGDDAPTAVLDTGATGSPEPPAR